MAHGAWRMAHGAWRMASVALGLFLLAAACLKGQELLTGPVAQTILPTSPWFHAALIEGELLLGLWLLSGGYARAAWGAALVFFSALACASLYLAAVVQAARGMGGDAPLTVFVQRLQARFSRSGRAAAVVVPFFQEGLSPPTLAR
jgi:hypothetical protein